MKNEQPVLVMLIPGFPANEADTTCLPAQQHFVRAVNRNFPELKIIIISFQYPFMAAEYDWHGNKVIAFGGSNKGKVSRLLVWWKIWRQLKALRKQYPVAGLFSCWCGECALIGNRFGKKYGIAHYCWILGQDARQPNPYVQRIRPAPNELIALSDFLAAAFYRNYSIKPQYIIPNGIESSGEEILALETDIDILGVGSLIPLKQYDVFIELIGLLKQQFPGIKAVICGKGTEENCLRSLITKYALEDNLSLVGEQPYEQVQLLMQRSKILLHPSSYEGFSTVCLEALYAGARVVSYRRAMEVDIKNWHIVTTKEEMLDKLRWLLNDKESKREKLIPYSMDQTARSIIHLFLPERSIIN